MGKSKAEEIDGNGNMEKVSQLKGYLRSDYEIIRKTSADGERTYHHKDSGRKLDVADQSLDGIIQELLAGSRGMAQVIISLNNSRCSCTNEELDIDDVVAIVKNHVHSVEAILGELLYVIENSIGDVSIESLDGDNTCYRSGRMLHAYVEFPPSEDKNDGFSYDHDPELLELVKSIPPDRTSQLMYILRGVKNGERLQWCPEKREG